MVSFLERFTNAIAFRASFLVRNMPRVSPVSFFFELFFLFNYWRFSFSLDYLPAFLCFIAPYALYSVFPPYTFDDFLEDPFFTSFLLFRDCALMLNLPTLRVAERLLPLILPPALAPVNQRVHGVDFDRRVFVHFQEFPK